MAIKSDLKTWVIEALAAEEHPATIVDICENIWNRHEAELRGSGKLFFTWQIDARQAAINLRRSGVLKKAPQAPGLWVLNR